MPNITIDEHQIEVEEGVVLLDAARRLGIEIPTLCYHEALSPYGSCRVCQVEIIYNGRSKLTTACTYPAWDGLVVKTDSPKVLAARRFVVKLLLTRCPNVPEIQELAAKLGIKSARFNSSDPEEKCILCGHCVRVCRDIVGASALSFINRGIKRKVETPFQTVSSDCIGCGACAFVCPTGAITIEDIGKIRKLHNWHTELELAQCKVCGSNFTTLKELDYLKKKVDLPEDTFELCQNCRRERLSKQIGEVKVRT